MGRPKKNSLSPEWVEPAQEEDSKEPDMGPIQEVDQKVGKLGSEVFTLRCEIDAIKRAIGLK